MEFHPPTWTSCHSWATNAGQKSFLKSISPLQGKFTLLRDSRTDGSFLVHHFLSFYLRAGCKVCFLALVQSFSHYNIVAQKLGISLTAAKEQGQLVFLEGLKSCLDLVFGEEEQSGQPSPLQFIR
ncbi:elongator complex protein 6-like [Centrocercus urophasianus]|uniref:elongator complex protein 6-like n=1 Tax=Centrocercus urophasianus TaxID=9002 RepID=UPI001C647634|nr:elongator complex protein 6-like [Centrocercus urophasianus]